MKWSQLKKRISDHLADCVKTRVDFFSTAYRKAHDEYGRGWITIDKEEIINMDSMSFEIALYRSRNYEKKEKELFNKNIFSQWTLYHAISDYLNLSFPNILANEHPIIRAIGMLDKRLGKRKLKTLDMGNEHALVKRFYHLRCEALSITLSTDINDSLHTHINKSKKATDNYKDIRDEAISYLETYRKRRNPSKIISSIAENKLNKKDLNDDISKTVFGLYKSENEKEHNTLTAILTFLEHKTKLIKDKRFIKGITALIKDREYWIRNIFDWSPESHNAKHQFFELSRYLLAKYSVPEFMDTAYIEDNKQHQEWFRHIGEGKNIRTMDNIPITLTKKMAHYFMTAPTNYPIAGALRWGQIHALGGNARLANALLETRLIRDFNDDAFWLSVIKFLNNNPMLDTVYINPIIDYIWNQKYEPQIIFVERGVAEEQPPAQPNFSMRGRTINSLLKDVDRWHVQLGRQRKGGNFQWEKSPIPDFQFIEGSEKSKNMKIWRIEELLSSAELIDEGRKMNHCVATYAHSCHKDKCSIWAMSIQQEDCREKCLTIEINKKNNTICQVRGKRNRLASTQEKDIIKRWANQEGLSLASYI